MFHFCLVDPNIEGLAKRIIDMGGKQRSDIWALFEGEPFKAVYCEDPWGNLIEIYSHSTELMYANRDIDAFMIPAGRRLEDHR